MTSLHKKFSLAASSFMVKLTIIVIAAVGGGALVSSAVVAALTVPVTLAPARADSPLPLPIKYDAVTLAGKLTLVLAE